MIAFGCNICSYSEKSPENAPYRELLGIVEVSETNVGPFSLAFIWHSSMHGLDSTMPATGTITGTYAHDPLKENRLRSWGIVLHFRLNISM